MKNKTKEVKADWEKDIGDELQILMENVNSMETIDEDGTTSWDFAELRDALEAYIKKNFVAKGEVRNEIKRWLEDDYYSEGEAWVKAKLVEQLLKSLE